LAERIAAALRLYAFAVLGIFLLVVPWTPLWDQAVRSLLPPPGSPWVVSGWMRGIVSALGVLNLLAAAREAAGFWKSLTGEDA
jgi:hypothetical protein